MQSNTIVFKGVLYYAGRFENLKNISLFDGIESKEFDSLFSCIAAKKESYQKHEFISINGDSPKGVGIVLSGQVQIIKEDIYGNRAILSNVASGNIFGESFVCSGNFTLTISIQAIEDASILFLPFGRVMNICQNACNFHQTLVRNMLILIANKNIKLLEKLEISSKRTLREKVITYLSQLAQEQNSITVTSSMGRIDLADFLSVNRSALTRELNNMTDDGIITFEKSTYTLLGIDNIPNI